jgi:hypothetical protein
MRRRRPHPTFSSVFSRLRKQAAACFLHAARIRGKQTFVKDANRLNNGGIRGHKRQRRLDFANVTVLAFA